MGQVYKQRTWKMIQSVLTVARDRLFLVSSTRAAADARLAALVFPSSGLEGVSSCELSDSVRRAKSRVSRRCGRGISKF